MFFCHYKCHTERSEVSLLMYGFEILHIQLLTLAPSGVDRWFAALIENLFNFYIKEWSE